VIKKVDVCYYALGGDKSSKQVAERIGAAGFFIVLQPVDPTITLGGAKIGVGIGSGDLHVVDLGEGTIDAAKFILENFPAVKGKIFVVEPSPSVDLETDGLISVTRESLVERLREIPRD